MARSLRDCSPEELREANHHFYEQMWSDARLVAPDRFNTWPLVSRLASSAAVRLEVAPGLRPRLPIQGTCFADLSRPAVACLAANGASAVCAPVTRLPYADGAFSLVCALDIIEHIDDDGRALAELSRVAAEGAVLLLSVPLYAAAWTAFDDFVGHRRRYEPDALPGLLGGHGFAIEQSAVFGMQPGPSKMMDFGMWCLEHRRQRAMWCYNHIFMPLGLWFQKKLRLDPGLVVAPGVDEIFLVCRKSGPTIATPMAGPRAIP